jgi:hypothetical protein
MLKTPFVLGFLTLSATLAPAQVNVEFGQNRVQYHDFEWQFIETENFVTYFYLGGQDLGRYVSQVAEEELDDIEKTLDFKVTDRIEVLVYNDVTDLNQSNIGVGLQLSNTGGVTQIIGNKVFVSFNGDHTDLFRQVREGIARVLINNMMFGGSVTEVVQNAILLNLPDWFINGLVAYIGEGWNSESDSRLRDGILSGRFQKFSKLQGEEATLAGQSFWYYVAENFGGEAIPNLLYLTRINRSLENGFLFVLGYPYRLAIEEWYKYFLKRYESESVIGIVPSPEQRLDWKQRREWSYSRLRSSPGGKYVAYVGHRLGEWRVWLLEVETGDTKVITKGGFKTKTFGRDAGYPLIAFDASGKTLVVAFEKRDEPKLMVYTLATRDEEVREMGNFQRIVDLRFADNRKLLISAINRGQSDIYTYNVGTRQIQQLTNDFYDDLDPAWVSFGQREGIVFASNRISDTNQRTRFDTILPRSTFDLYFYNEMRSDRDVLTNLTNTPDLSESFALQIDTMHFSYIGDANGIHNRYAGYIDSTFARYDHIIYYKDSTVTNPRGDWDSILTANKALIDSVRHVRVLKDTAYVFPLSNLSYGILEQDVDTFSGKTLDLMFLEGRFQFIETPIPAVISEDYAPTLIDTEHRKTSQRSVTTSTVPDKDDKKPVYYFQTGFDETDTTWTMTPSEQPSGSPATRVQSYHVKFSTDYVLSQLDNSLIFTQYQNFVGTGPIFQTPDLSGLITLSISDLFEDHRISGGFRVPTSFGGSEYFFSYDNLRKRLDKKLLVYRKVESEQYSVPGWFRPVSAKKKTHYYEGSVKYPFDILRSLRAKAGYRNYRVVFLSEDQVSGPLPDYVENWASARLEYVFDNTYEVMLNILNGTRYKFYAEVQKQFDFQLDPKVDISFSEGFLSVLGFDARHYQRIHRQIIWANRIAGATSNGSKRVIYYLGGVDNWMFPKFNSDIDVNDPGKYAFQALATNLRGFSQNIRNGNSYVVINSELRIPVFAYLVNAPIRSELLRNFQIVGFGDIGTAWEGFSPFAQDNPFNTEIIEKGPVKALVKYFRNPVVGGYCVGVRSVLFGYFIRVDMAWGMDTGVVQKPQWYISLSTDF